MGYPLRLAGRPDLRIDDPREQRRGRGLWGAGRRANVYRFREERWRRTVIHPTDLELESIWVSPDGQEAWAAAPSGADGTYLFAYRDGEWTRMHYASSDRLRQLQVREGRLSGHIRTGVCFPRDNFVLTDVASLYRLPRYPGGQIRRHGLSEIFWPAIMVDMTGSGPNDITFVGHFGTVMHFNGRSFHVYDEIRTPSGILFLQSVDQLNDRIVVVGADYGTPEDPPAVIYMGRR